MFVANDATAIVTVRTKPLLHLWSLAVEEQFYILWPLLLEVVWHRRQSFLVLTVTIAVASFATKILLVPGHPVPAFYSPFSRFWELMVGGVLAHLSLYRPAVIARCANSASALGFVALLVGLIAINERRSFPGWWALLPTLGAFGIIA